MRMDVFCRVVDNYGDAGVTWRLARQWAREHGVAVTLWIDQPAALARIAPGIEATVGDQMHSNVRVRRLDDASDIGVADLPDGVIEGFGCGLPSAYLNRMAEAPRPPVWINLEYLSAEAWIESAHGLPSPHPRLPLTRYFYFPGFTRATGGLLREAGLLEARDAARGAVSRPLPGGWAARGAAQCVVTLFCYSNTALPGLLEAWAGGGETVLCIRPEGIASAEIAVWRGAGTLAAGDSFTSGSLTLATVAFMSQPEYDRVLWSADFNFARGEDSFVRAQWAGRPLAWHIYPQPADAHRAKLDAFLDRHLAGAPAAAAATLRSFSQAWNDGDPSRAAAAWVAMRAERAALAVHASVWAGRLADQPDLARQLLRFCRDRL